MATKDKEYLVQVYNRLDNSLTKQVAALPNVFNKQRFIQNCMTVLQDGQADFSKCDPSTVSRTLMKGAFLGLDFFNGECYAIPYGNTCQFQTDYKGEIKLAKKYSSNPIKDIYAKVVRSGDEFEEVIIDGRQSINFKPLPFNDGDIIGAFAVVYFEDGSMLYDTMSKAEIEHTRHSYSKAANSKAWTNSFGEMCKKTVLRRLCKLIDLDFDNADQCKAFEEGGDAEFNKAKEVYKSKDVYANEEPEQEEAVIDADYTEVTEEVSSDEQSDDTNAG